MTDALNTPTIEQIHRHASARSYRPDPVSPAVVEAIVAAGQRASTSSNLQMWSVVAVAGAATRQTLADLCGQQKHIAQAPLFLAWCADLARLEQACARRGYSQVTGYVENFLVAAVDAAIAMQNAALAAESLGLGICYIGAIRNRPQEVIELLGLPPLVMPIAGMTVGWPAVEPKLRPRLPLEVVLHWERYDSSGQDQALAEYDRDMAATGIYAGRQAPVPGRPGEVEDYGWTEHSARRVSQAHRVHLREVVEKQGFGLK
ncbi:MAG TPA: NADPH-dependent oxidoreductase [Anaerolineae bacterium]|nr:NADPH-dependent oxidoreductase [Anaerolineae bacterium]